MIHQVDNFLKEDSFQKISNQFSDKQGWESSKYFWPKSLFEYYTGSPIRGAEKKRLNSCLVGKGDFDEYNENLTQLVGQLSGKKVEHIETLMYQWTEGSCILWHDDHGHDVNVTLYMSHWDRNWGGELLLENGTWVAPEKNKLVIFMERMQHKTTLRLPEVPPRLSLQTFIRFKKPDEGVYYG
jgi:Rps23 Pro-64 3,4-dihydroxylase Tpa1-like proline 4-hydroxylase